MNEYIAQIVLPVLVTVSGSPGSGKSTMTKTACELLGAERLYVGQIRRDMARGKGMTLEQFNKYALTDPRTDVDVDNAVAAQARILYNQRKSIFVEGRTQFHFLPESFKVYVFIEPREGGRRIFEDMKVNAAARNGDLVDTLDETIAKNEWREQNDAERYMRFYKFDHRDLKHYDCVIDSTHLSKEQVVDAFLRAIYGHQQRIRAQGF